MILDYSIYLYLFSYEVNMKKYTKFPERQCFNYFSVYMVR